MTEDEEYEIAFAFKKIRNSLRELSDKIERLAENTQDNERRIDAQSEQLHYIELKIEAQEEQNKMLNDRLKHLEGWRKWPDEPPR